MKWEKLIKNLNKKEKPTNEEIFNIISKYKSRLIVTDKDTTLIIYAESAEDIPTQEELDIILNDDIKVLITKPKKTPKNQKINVEDFSDVKELSESLVKRMKSMTDALDRIDIES